MNSCVVNHTDNAQKRFLYQLSLGIVPATQRQNGPPLSACPHYGRFHSQNHPIYRGSYMVETRDTVPFCVDVQLCLSHKSRQIKLSGNENKS